MISDALQELNLQDKQPQEQTKNYVKYNLTQQEYARTFSLVDNNDSEWYEDEDEIDNIEDDIIVNSYYSDWGKLVLTADLDADTYQLEITEEDND